MPFSNNNKTCFTATIKAASLLLLELAKAADCEDILAEIPAHENDSLEELKNFLDHVWHAGMPFSYMQGPIFRTDCYLDNEEKNIIRWEGTWTKGRYVQITFFASKALIEFDTGTGKPSTYLTKIFNNVISKLMGEARGLRVTDRESLLNRLRY